MTGKKPGLPDGFALEIPQGDVDDRPPANIGDFLDEDDALTRAPVMDPESRPAPPERRRDKVAGRIEPKARPATRGRRSSEAASQRLVAPSAAPTRPTAVQKPLRRQINLTLDADEVINELLAVIKRYSDEPHPNASDVLNALVLAAGEAIKQLQLQTVPRRGKYGEPTVRIYLQQLKTALQDAIAQHEKYKG